jgi:hypothetical protein
LTARQLLVALEIVILLEVLVLLLLVLELRNYPKRRFLLLRQHLYS